MSSTGCPLSLVLFNIFFENNMQATIKDFNTITSIGGMLICNLRIADEIDLIGRSENELQNLTNRLEEKTTAYGMEISSEKSKVLLNSTNQKTPIDITMNGQKEVNSFK